MNRLDLWVAAAVTALGLFMALVGVPEGVVTPKSVRIPVLSPAFWPTILVWLLVGLGAVLAVVTLSGGRTAGEAGRLETAGAAGKIVRLLLLAGLLAAFVMLIPVIGMVWASLLAGAGLLLLGRSPYPVAGLILVVVLPLVLYGFFQHVAGVAVPQGNWVTLP